MGDTFTPFNREEGEFTKSILSIWTANDNALREKMGLPAERSHDVRPSQVFYAKYHAIALQEVMKCANEAKHQASGADWARLDVRMRAGKAMRDAMISETSLPHSNKTIEQYIGEIELDLSKNFGFYEPMIIASNQPSGVTK